MSYLPAFSPETWTLFALFLTLLIVYGYWPYGAFRKLAVPGPKPLPFFGTLLEYRKGFFNFDMDCFKKYGRMWGFYDGRQPVLAVMDTEMIKTILVKECYSLFTNRRNFRLNGPLYDAVSIVEDEDWRRIRSVLSPCFTSGRLKEMFPIMKHYADNLVQHVQKKADQNEAVQVKELFGPYSMDVVTSTAFSVNIDSMNNPSDPFVTNIKKMLKFNFLDPILLIISLFPFVSPLMEKMEFSLFPTSVTNYFFDSLRKIKTKRQQMVHDNRVDFLQLMVDSQVPDKVNNTKAEQESVKGLTDHEILSQSMIFIFAGYETTSSSLSFLAYNLATNPDCMKKLQEEIDRTFPNKAPVTYEAVTHMEYLDMAVNESLRLYPPAARVERVCKQTVKIGDVTIPKGMVIMIPSYVLHRDPQLWSEPEVFKPERFSKANKESTDPYAFLPFGAGPRNCIGMRFAIILMKLAIVQILQNFSIITCKETEIPPELDIQGFIGPKKPLTLKFRQRSSYRAEE
ncbi:cytochrome P450 3A40 isoform X2 [Amia ocellicauda]|uniref:cytochrome P450 3A40 isoform X2 n=1 Tax=Amia ocellicauda TaxID=2972642 RepID=UPI003464BDBA